MDTKRIEMVQREITLTPDSVIVHPDVMAICAADQRYYCGKRKREIMAEKLPMALIHEAVGTVFCDFSKTLKAGTKVAMFPLHGTDETIGIKANYQEAGKFNSSNTDGFMRDFVVMSHDQVVPITEHYQDCYVFGELISVAVGAIENIKNETVDADTVFGVWGDGSMGYVTALTLKCIYPHSKVFVFGKTARKLNNFSFADKRIYIDNIPRGICVHHAFECVGNKGSETAIKQILDTIMPQGSINLLGVSEEPVGIVTRKLLEKGITLIGNNRSNIKDFRRAFDLIATNPRCAKYLPMLISETVNVKTEDDIRHAFEQDLLNDFKTVIRWLI
jgi:ribitol-5-phosphate 2-dehydrogenase